MTLLLNPLVSPPSSPLCLFFHAPPHSPKWAASRKSCRDKLTCNILGLGRFIARLRLTLVLQNCLHNCKFDFHFSSEDVMKKKTQECARRGLLEWNFCWEFPTSACWRMRTAQGMHVAEVERLSTLSELKQVGLTQVLVCFWGGKQRVCASGGRCQGCLLFVCEANSGQL